MAEDGYDFYSDEFQSDPATTYQRMIEKCPHHHSQEWGWYSVFRYADIDRIINDNVTYSARQGPGPANTEATPLVLVSADPPEHTVQKRAVARVFNLRSMEAMEPGLRTFVASLLDDLTEKGGCDLIEDVAIPVPLWIICQLLGLDFDSDAQKMREWVVVMAGGVFSQDRDMNEDVKQAAVEMAAFFEPLVDEKLAKLAAGEDPGDDVLSLLAKVEIDGWRLSKYQLMSFANFLVIAGSGTTTNTIGNFFVGVLDHPDQYALLRQKPELLEQAVDEILRFYAPVYGLFRTNNVSVDLDGLEVPEDSKICLMWGSANRDPEVWENANTLDITRDLSYLRKHSMSLGGGIHRCMGAPLARMEVRVVADEFLKRFPDFRETGQRVAYPYATLNGLDHLHLAW
jgi:cytochrome P450